MEKFIEMLKEAVGKDVEGDGEAYKKFFNKKLKKFGVKSVNELSDADKKKFHAEIEKEWHADDEGDDGKKGTKDDDDEEKKMKKEAKKPVYNFQKKKKDSDGDDDDSDDDDSDDDDGKKKKDNGDFGRLDHGPGRVLREEI